jgi:hypothetical protein
LATEDACGTCDDDPTNDCFDGTTGVLLVADSSTFNPGTGEIRYSIAGPQTGWLYSGRTVPDVSYARLTDSSSCEDVAASGYTSTPLQGITDASALTFEPANPPILFGTWLSTCSMGPLVFFQNGQYGVLEFAGTQDGGEPGIYDDLLIVYFWVGNPGETDFSNAPPLP